MDASPIIAAPEAPRGPNASAANGSASTGAGTAATVSKSSAVQGNTNGGNKGRSNGGRLKNLLLKFGGGSAQKTNKPAALSSPTNSVNTPLKGKGNPKTKVSNGNSMGDINAPTFRNDDTSLQKRIDGTAPPSSDIGDDKAGPSRVGGDTHKDGQKGAFEGLSGSIKDGDTHDSSRLDQELSPEQQRWKRSRRDGDEDMDDEDGADPDASIRPITPSSIDASSSFTGSASLHSLAPTSRTFKSFITGHSKTSVSASTRQNTNLNSSTAAAAVSSPNTTNIDELREGARQIEQHERSTTDSPDKTVHVDGGSDMRSEGANRIATSIHSKSLHVIEPSHSANVNASTSDSPTTSLLTEHGNHSHVLGKGQAAKASPLRHSFTGPSATSTPSPKAEAHHAESLRSGPADIVLPSSSSITFSQLPPVSPASHSFEGSSITGSPLAHPATLAATDHETSNTYSHDSFEGSNKHLAAEVVVNYPRHSLPNPKNNPRASSPPPDNASTLTLASSTGMPTPSLYTNAPSRYAGSVNGDAKDRHVRGSGSYGGVVGGANEDASIRAIPPSRRDSYDSLGSRWSAAVLSNKDFTSQLDGQPPGDNGSLRRKTPSLRTVATTASSYYAAPQPPTSPTADIRS